MVSHLLRLAEKESSSYFLLFPKAMKNVKDVNQWIVAGGVNIWESKKVVRKEYIIITKTKVHTLNK